MAGQLHNFSDTCANPADFTSSLQLLMGADFQPDPLFLEEAWRLGLPAAAENWHRRRRDRDDSNRRVPAERDTLSFCNSAQWAAEYVSLRTVPTEDSRPRTSPGWTPQAWTPLDRAEQRWIPHGWTPRGWAPNNDPSPSQDAPARDGNMTSQRACEILAVSPDSTREQVRSAYRRQVGACHPDRLQRASDKVRRTATDRLAKLNQAYRLLCDLLQQAA